MGYRRFYSELSSSFSGSDSAFSQSSFSGTVIGGTTYTFQKVLQTIRLDITQSTPGTVNFILTPSGSGRSIVEKVLAWGEGMNISASFAVYNGGEAKQITNGFWTGTLANADVDGYITASLNYANTLVPAGARCYVTSSAGQFALQVFYRTQE